MSTAASPAVSSPAISGAHHSVRLPASSSFIRKLLAFSGPGYLVAVGYMDPGNWATDLAGGSKYGYALLSVVIIASFFAIILQYLSIKLGIATGKDLAQMTSQHVPRPIAFVLWLAAEAMIIACDLAEVIGTAIALQLLFQIPLIVGVVLTVLDVFLLLALQSRGVRYLEALVIVLITTVVGCFAMELFFARPDIAPMMHGLLATSTIFSNSDMLFIAIGILGATVMPHNLYLHSSVVQTRDYARTDVGRKEALKFSTIDSTIALTIACFVNAAILIVAASTFYASGHREVVEIGDAYHLLTPLLGAGVAATLFGVALLASGVNSTVTATMAGQIIMEGFVNLKLRPWIRRLITRGLAVIPAAIIVVMAGSSGLAQALVTSQVILSLQLPFVVLPLIYFTSRKKFMGPLANGRPIMAATSAIGIIIVSLNGWLVWSVMSS